MCNDVATFGLEHDFILMININNVQTQIWEYCTLEISKSCIYNVRYSMDGRKPYNPIELCDSLVEVNHLFIVVPLVIKHKRMSYN
jgi:hypothetical protein